MPVFENEWTSKKGTFAFALSERHMVDVWVTCTKIVRLYGVRGTQDTLLKAGAEFRFREKLKGYQKLRIVGPGQTEFGVKIRETPLREFDYNSGEKAPVLELPEPSNLVARFRAMARAHHQGNAYPVLEPEDGPSFGRYEVDDEAEVLFEEEAWAAAQERKKKAAEKAKEKATEKAARDNEAPPVASESRQEPPQGASDEVRASAPVPPTQAAE